jgi:hypothetical protein
MGSWAGPIFGVKLWKRGKSIAFTGFQIPTD